MMFFRFFLSLCLFVFADGCAFGSASFEGDPGGPVPSSSLLYGRPDGQLPPTSLTPLCGVIGVLRAEQSYAATLVTTDFSRRLDVYEFFRKGARSDMFCDVSIEGYLCSNSFLDEAGIALDPPLSVYDYWGFLSDFYLFSPEVLKQRYLWLGMLPLIFEEDDSGDFTEGYQKFIEEQSLSDREEEGGMRDVDLDVLCVSYLRGCLPADSQEAKLLRAYVLLQEKVNSNGFIEEVTELQFYEIREDGSIWMPEFLPHQVGLLTSLSVLELDPVVGAGNKITALPETLDCLRGLDSFLARGLN